MTWSFYTNKVLFAEDLTSYFLNKHLWQNTPFGAKIVAPTTGRQRTQLYNVFNSNVKGTVDILHACLLRNIKQTFGNIVLSGNVTVSFFASLAITLRNDYFYGGVNAGNFLHYSVILASLSAFFYAWGCKDAPERAVEFISGVFPDYALFHPFCIRLNEACRSFLQKEQPLLTSILRDPNFARVPNACDVGLKCGCFEIEETGKSFRMIFKKRKLALKKHATFCVANVSYSLETCRIFHATEAKESYIRSWNLKSGKILRKASVLSKLANDTVPFTASSNQEVDLQQESFGFPNKPFLYINKCSKISHLSSKDGLQEHKLSSTETNEKIVRANDSCGKEATKTLNIFCEEFATESETFQQQEESDVMDSCLEGSSIESSDSDESPAEACKPVIAKITSLQNEQVIGCLNDNQAICKTNSNSITENSAKLNEQRVATFLSKIVLESANYFKRSFLKGSANEHLKINLEMGRSKTIINLTKELPSPCNSKEQCEDCQSLSGKLPDSMPLPAKIQTSKQFKTKISGVQDEPLELFHHSSGEKCMCAVDSTSSTMTDLVILGSRNSRSVLSTSGYIKNILKQHL